MTKKLLLADDSITIQKVVGIIFATEDFQLTVTENGDDAYEKALQEIPDLVISDISMPGKDGFELCEAIKSDSRLTNTSVLLLPGTFEHFDEQRAEAVGADGWIHKPFESQALLDKVLQLLEATPVRLDSAAETAAAAEEEPADLEITEPVEEQPTEEQPVDEVVLGLDEVEEPAGQNFPVEEESPEDIWDAVSFEEEDLQGEIEPSAAAEEPVAEVDFSTAEGLVSDEGVEAVEPQETEAFAETAEETPVEMEEVSTPAMSEESLAELAATDNLVDFGGENEEPSGVTEEVAESVAESTGFEEEPFASSEETAFEPEEEEFVATAPEQEDPLELEEEAIVEEEAATTVEPAVETEEEEEILDLAEEDVLEEETFATEPEEEALELAEEEEEVAEEEDAFIIEEPSDEEPVSAELEGYETGEEVFSEAIDMEPEVVDDEGFYFDDAAAAEEAIAESGKSKVKPAAALSGAALAQVEQQLRKLSEDELKDVVGKVAGPMIEKLAGEMLAQIAWEVVPDLAEAMIREEIRKIKQGVE